LFERSHLLNGDDREPYNPRAIVEALLDLDNIQADEYREIAIGQ
jgi:hypothetical protein